MKWEVLFSGMGSAQHHMDIDHSLLQDISNIGHPILRFYDWEGPCATYGYFIKPMDYLNPSGIEKWGLKLGRRPTGGGIVFHLTDLAFSVLVPAAHPAYSRNTLENYSFVNKHVARAMVSFKKGLTPTLLQAEEKPVDVVCRHFCMAKPTIYDVMIDGKKVGGAAQRQTREGFLHQGTISITMPEEAFLAQVLKPDTEVLEAMKSHSYMFMEDISHAKQINEIRRQLQQLLIAEFLSPLC